MTALTGQHKTAYAGSTFYIGAKSLKDDDGNVIDWTSATAASLKITSAQGSGSEIVSKTLDDATTTTTRIEWAITAADMSSATAGTTYWYEWAVNFGAGLEQVVAPSKLVWAESAT